MRGLPFSRLWDVMKALHQSLHPSWEKHLDKLPKEIPLQTVIGNTSLVESGKGIGMNMDNMSVYQHADGKETFSKKNLRSDSVENNLRSKKIYDAFGIKSPEMYHNPDNNEMVVEGVPGESIWDVHTQPKPTDENIRTCAVRLLTGDADAHWGNWMNHQGKMIPIDFDQSHHETGYGCMVSSRAKKSAQCMSGDLYENRQRIMRTAHDLTKTPEFQKVRHLVPDSYVDQLERELH